jgi:hypothetical protein
MELAEIYSRAADYIEDHGWIQHNLEDPSGRVCLWGALRRVTGWGLDSASELSELINREMCQELADSTTRWNDAPGRSKEEVIAFLREQAVKAGLSVPATHIIEIPEPEPLELPVAPEPEPVKEPELVPA